MSCIHQIGSGAYISVNVGSGTPQEAADWMEYMTAAAPTTLAKERAANGHPAPYKVGFMGIGNESWSCGGDMTADYYLSQLKIYSRFVHNDNPLQQGANHMLEIAVGPGVPETNWTETIMKAWQHHEGVAASRLELEYRWPVAALVYRGHSIPNSFEIYHWYAYECRRRPFPESRRAVLQQQSVFSQDMSVGTRQV